jgi:hypothetical protein
VPLKKQPQVAPVTKTEESPLEPGAREDRIRARAYELYLEREGGEGSELGDWLRAEAEILQAEQ